MSTVKISAIDKVHAIRTHLISHELLMLLTQKRGSPKSPKQNTEAPGGTSRIKARHRMPGFAEGADVTKQDEQLS